MESPAIESVRPPAMGSGVFELASRWEAALRQRRPESAAVARCTEAMRALADFQLTMSIAQDQSDAVDANLLVLDGLRMLHMQVIGRMGDAMRKVVASITNAAGLARFDEARKAAIENLAELRAFVAMVTGEHDDEDLGIEVIPPGDWDSCDSSGGKSVSLPL